MFLDILYKIIDSSDEDYILKYAKKYNISLKKGYGLPIGNLTSQILGVFYLNDLDHYIKEVLKIKYYIRYMKCKHLHNIWMIWYYFIRIKSI